MAEVRKILFQAAPSSGALTDLGTVPALKEWIVSTLFACNRSTAAGALRLAVATASGVAATGSHYLYYDVAIPANETLAVTAGITLQAAGVVRAYHNTSAFSFNAFGVEIDV